MNNFFEQFEWAYSFIKGVFAFVMAGIANVLFPVQNFLIIIAVLFSLNFIFGFVASKKIDKESFHLQKALRGFRDLFFYFGIIVMAYIIGKYMSVKNDHEIEFISWLTWVMIYFYALNTVKNIHKIAPENRFFAFLYWFLNVEFVKKIPFIDKYFKSKEDENK